jgi:hypothetical protein
LANSKIWVTSVSVFRETLIHVTYFLYAPMSFSFYLMLGMMDDMLSFPFYDDDFCSIKHSMWAYYLDLVEV